ncbi:MAG: DoxX family protein [Acidobacteria bacterium]|nr:MAG: DoxX family protein [Acidobacteriota bacterium]
MKYVLWVIQVLLALLFLFAGGVKLVMPIQTLEEQAHISGLFLKFIAIVEILGALGLVLPGVFKIRQGLMPLAAAGLVIIMIGATVVTLQTLDAAMAILPAVTGILAAFVAYGRWRLVRA